MSDQSGAKGPLKSIERRAERIERWLRRCVAACRSSAWSSALMEIECAEAETKGMREDLWSAAQAEADGRPAAAPATAFARAAKVAALALVFVLTLNMPLSLDQDRAPMLRESMSIELLTSTESEMLDTLRRSLSGANAGRLVVEIEVPAAPADEPLASAAEAMPTRENAPAAVPAPVKRVVLIEAPKPEVKPAKSPSIETVLSLMQIGERALRGGPSGITVIK